MDDLKKITNKEKIFFADILDIKYLDKKNIDYSINLHNKYVKNLNTQLYHFMIFLKKHKGESLNFVLKKERQKVIDKIKYGDTYNTLINTPNPAKDFVKKDFDMEEGDYISIDMVKANWEVFSKFGNNLYTWYDFLKALNIHDFLTYSKRFRQQIFGNLSPKRIQNLQKLIITDCVKLLNEIHNIDIRMISEDEIIVKDNGKTTFEDVTKKMHKIIYNKVPLKIQKFEFRRNKSKFLDKEFFTKKYKDNEKLYGVEKKLTHIFTKEINNKGLTKEDITIRENNINYKIDVNVNLLDKIKMYIL